MKSFTAIAVLGLAAIVSAQDPSTTETGALDTTTVIDTTTAAADVVTTTAVDATTTADATVNTTDAADTTGTATDDAINNTGLSSYPSSTPSSMSPSVAPTGGVSPQRQSCQAAYTLCSSSYTDAQKCSNDLATCQAACKATQAQCVGAGNGGATCAAEAVLCLGTNPYGSQSSGPTGTDAGVTTVTSVVPSFVTYCPGATQFTTNGQVYTATGAGYITVTNCPCTITSVVGSTPTGSSSKNGNGTSTGYQGPKYTGAANKVIGASLSVVAAGAAFFAFAL